MKGSDRRACGDEIVQLAALVQTGTGPAVAAWAAFSGELPGRGFDSGGRGGGSDDDGGPTARLAVRGTKKDPKRDKEDPAWDRFIRDRELFDASLELARDALREAHRLVLTATVYEAQPESAPACRSCSRQNDTLGKPIYSPVHGQGLCQWCLTWQRTHGAWPALKLIELHHRGIRISEQMAARYSKAAS